MTPFIWTLFFTTSKIIEIRPSRHDIPVICLTILGIDLGCSQEIETGNSPNAFGDVLFTFDVAQQQSIWQKTWEPACDSTGLCTGYIDIPVSVQCNIEPLSGYRRLCHCMDQGKKYCC